MDVFFLGFFSSLVFGLPWSVVEQMFSPLIGSWPSNGLDGLWSNRGLLFKLGVRIWAKWVASVLPRGPLVFRMLV